MPAAKKLLFAPLFLITFTSFVSFLSFLFNSYDFIFSFSSETLINLIIICLILSLSCFLFVIFTALSSNWKIILPVAILASLIPLFFLESSLAIVFSVGVLISLALTYLNLQTALKNYLTFAPNAIFGPSIRQLSALLILSICIVYFLSANKMIAKNGFEIPDSLIDASLSLSPLGSQDLVKQAVKDQFQNLIKPYSSFISPMLALLLFFTLQGITALINLLIYPLLWLTFYILEKTGFITFTVEQKPVKKMVI